MDRPNTLRNLRLWVLNLQKVWELMAQNHPLPWIVHLLNLLTSCENHLLCRYALQKPLWSTWNRARLGWKKARNRRSKHLSPRPYRFLLGKHRNPSLLISIQRPVKGSEDLCLGNRMISQGFQTYLWCQHALWWWMAELEWIWFTSTFFPSRRPKTPREVGWKWSSLNVGFNSDVLHSPRRTSGKWRLIERNPTKLENGDSLRLLPHNSGHTFIQHKEIQRLSPIPADSRRPSYRWKNTRTPQKRNSRTLETIRPWKRMFLSLMSFCWCPCWFSGLCCKVVSMSTQILHPKNPGFACFCTLASRIPGQHNFLD